MRDASNGKRGEPDRLKTVFLLCLVMVPALLWAACGTGYASQADQSAPPASAARETVSITITAPSAGELTIAPGRHFKVSGSLSGEIPDDAVLAVEI